MTAGANDLTVRCQGLAPIALSAASNFDAAAAHAGSGDRDGRWISTPGATALLHVRFEEAAGLPEGSQWLEVLVRKRGTAHPAVLIDLIEWVARRRPGACEVAKEAGALGKARFRASDWSGGQVEARVEVPRNGHRRITPCRSLGAFRWVLYAGRRSCGKGLTAAHHKKERSSKHV